MRRLVQSAIVAALLFACYVATAAPGAWYGDPSELVAAAGELGVAHPPGYSLYLLLGKISLVLGGGGSAYGMNLLSALLAALSVGLFYLLLLRYTGSVAPSLFGAVSAGLSPLFWSHATMAEVYPLALLLLLAVPLSVELLPGKRGLFLAAYVAGMGGAHHPMGIFFLPAVALLLFARGVGLPAGRVWAWMAGFFALPWTVHIYLMIRAGSDALVRWGDTSTMGGVVRHVARVDYSDLLLARPGGGGLDLLHKLAIPWRYLYDDLQITLLLLSLIGAASFFGRKRVQGLSLLAVIILAALLLPALLEVEETAASIEGNRIFFLPFAFLACALAAGGLTQLARIGPAKWLPFLFLPLLIVPFVRGFPEQNRRGDRGAGELASIVLNELEQNATLRIAEGQLLFPVVYMQAIEGLREDVRVEAPRRVVHPRSAGGGPLYLSSAEGVPRTIQLVPWGITWRVVREETPLRWKRSWDDFALTTRPAKWMEPMEREVVFGFHLRYARNLLRARRTERALVELDKAEELAGRAEQGWIHITQVYQVAGLRDRAIESARRAVESDPLQWRNHLLAGITQMEGENLIGAVACFKEVCRLEPQNGLGYLYLADLLILLRRSDEAIEPARRGIALLPGHPLAAPIGEALGDRLRP